MALNFKIIPKKPELTFPSQPTPREIKTLSDIDNQESLRMNYPIVMFYKSNPCMNGLDPAKVIRDALAKTLVYYYPYAGRLIEGPDHFKLLVDCKAEGVVFLEADANVEIGQLCVTELHSPPCQYPELLMCDVRDDMIGCPLMFVQVTRFTCGGFVLAIRFNHVISDALGSLQFVNTMSEMAKGTLIPSTPPVCKRELLTARNRSCVTYVHPEYKTQCEGVKTSYNISDKKLVRKSFSFGPQEIEAIRKILPPEARRTSKFILITACLWRSRTRALQFAPYDDAQLSCMVNVSRQNELDLPLGYYGNAILCPTVVSNAKTLCASPLGYAISLVKEAKRQATLDYFKSTIGFLSMNPKAKLKWEFVVSDISKIGFDQVDLGWGKPVYGGTLMFGTFNDTPLDRYFNQKWEEVMLAPMTLPSAAMERFENELRRIILDPNEKYTNDQNISLPSKL